MEIFIKNKIHDKYQFLFFMHSFVYIFIKLERKDKYAMGKSGRL